MCKVIMFDDSQFETKAPINDLKKIFSSHDREIDDLQVINKPPRDWSKLSKDTPCLIIIKNNFTNKKKLVSIALNARKAYSNTIIALFSLNDSLKEEWQKAVPDSMFFQMPYLFSKLDRDFRGFFDKECINKS
jgi:hypothetical protein